MTGIVIVPPPSFRGVQIDDAAMSSPKLQFLELVFKAAFCGV